MRVAVVGATGTIGRPLVDALAAAGHRVTAISRSGSSVPGAGAVKAADASDAAAMQDALDGAEVVYHLVHSLGRPGFEALDRAAARAVASGAAAGGASQIVFLGGLGEEGADLSAHLRSRAETGAILVEGPVPVTTLRAAVVVAADSAAFETILALVDRLPVMVCPRWVSVETQPVALVDVTAALVAVCGLARSFGCTYDVGGPEVMTYRAMMERTARIRGRRPLLIEVPVLTPWLSSLWLHLVTPVNAAVTRPLIEGLKIPTLARDDSIWELVPGSRTGFDEAVRAALAATASA
jgi:uncharacterized protein YbjT (DUF2867 family)